MKTTKKLYKLGTLEMQLFVCRPRAALYSLVMPKATKFCLKMQVPKHLKTFMLLHYVSVFVSACEHVNMSTGSQGDQRHQAPWS